LTTPIVSDTLSLVAQLKIFIQKFDFITMCGDLISDCMWSQVNFSVIRLEN